jgi:hypothetical protein
MKRILIAQLARIERERRMASEDNRPRLQLPLPGHEPRAGSPASALETSAVSALMLAKAYTRY